MREERILGLDIGRRRIGVAVSDPLGLTAQPLDPIHYRGLGDACEQLEAILAQWEPVVRVVVGLPLELSGREGHAVRTMRRILRGLEPALGERPVEEWDERFSTVEAERVLIAGGVRRAQRKKVIDSASASLILQGYLEAHRDEEEPR